MDFDAFGKFPEQENALDQSFIDQFEGAGGEGISQHELEEILRRKSFQNYELIQGDITETVPSYKKEHPELKIALLHIDVDVYNPTKVILESLYQCVVPGGLIVLDDYGTVAGETKAVDEYFAGNTPRIEKLPISHIPAFIVK